MLISPLLAEDPVYMQMGENFRNGASGQRTTEVIVFTIVMVVVIFVIWVGHQILERRKRLQRTSPDALFVALCKAHRLRRRDRRALRGLARRLKLPHPAMIFVAPDRFDDSLLGEFDDDRRGRLVEIRNQLFGVTAGAELDAIESTSL